MNEQPGPRSADPKVGTFLDRVKRNTDKWGRESGRVTIAYEDARALIRCAEELRKHDPRHIALKWLDSPGAILE